MKTALLPDTSIWIDFLQHRQSYLRRRLAAGDVVQYTQPILMELLAGARDGREWTLLRRFVTGAHLVPFESVADFEGAAWIHRTGSTMGVRAGYVDCLILAVTQRAGTTLVTSDVRQAQLGNALSITVKLVNRPV